MMKSIRLLGPLAVCIAISGCGAKPEDRPVGWLKVTLDTAYRGQPLHFVAYFACVGKHVPGGSFGATPGTNTISMRPKSVGRTMPDGSFVAFRAPELCGGYFGKGPRAANWGSTPTPFIPLMTWADRERRPNTFEAYIAQQAYAAPSSKFGQPTAIAEPLSSVPAEIQPAAAGQHNVILQDTGIISDEDEIGYRRSERGFRATFGWQGLADAAPGHEFASDCLTEFRSGQLVPGREVHGHQTLEQCSDSLARITPFIWDGKRFEADPRRPGVLVFQRISLAMNQASYFAEGELIRRTGSIEKPPAYGKYDITSVSAPVRDPNLGV